MIASPHQQGTFTVELSPAGSPQTSVDYDYAGKQPIPAAGLAPARHTALWAAKGRHEKHGTVRLKQPSRTRFPYRFGEVQKPWPDALVHLDRRGSSPLGQRSGSRAIFLFPAFLDSLLSLSLRGLCIGREAIQSRGKTSGSDVCGPWKGKRTTAYIFLDPRKPPILQYNAIDENHQCTYCVLVTFL